jgi:hypothetical protein
MATKQNYLSIKTIGLSVSAVLAVPYVVIMIASLLLVGLLTTGSWQAFFLGIRLSTIAGLEIGFLGVGIIGFVVTLVFVSIYNALQRLVAGKSITPAQTSQLDRPTAKSWQVRLLVICLVLPALALPALRTLASAGIFGATSGDAGTTVQNPGSQMRPVAMGPIINTPHRESEPSFTADGRTMYFNCNSGDICVSHLIGA